MKNLSNQVKPGEEDRKGLLTIYLALIYILINYSCNLIILIQQINLSKQFYKLIQLTKNSTTFGPCPKSLMGQYDNLISKDLKV